MSSLPQGTDELSASSFFKFDASTWSTFRHSSDRLNLTEQDLQRLMAFNDQISLDEVSRIYLPLSRLLYLYYISRHDRLSVIHRFLGESLENVPFIISISGPVSVGKTTTARLLNELIGSWPNSPKVSLITTDGFLYPNEILNQRLIMSRKGFPISYDTKKLLTFLKDVKDGKPHLKVPVYSHVSYDVVKGAYTEVDRPNVLIIEGVNVLQNGSDYPDIRNRAFISDFIDFSIYVDADEEHLLKWYIERFLKLREKTFNDPTSYFHRYANLPEEQAISIAQLIWEAVNHVNLVENILPCRERAHLILCKGANHTIDEVWMRK
ncbi:MAG: type I pantothenate kinase [Succinivibrio sp.]|nr:type I pantothenate kinase [Succinivibrio sp.]